MSFSDSLKVALEALNANKLRAMLTMLGIIIGVGSVIALMAVGQGSQKAITDQILGLGSNLLFVRPGDRNSGGVRAGNGSAQTLSTDDAKAIARTSPVLHGVAPELTAPAQIIGGAATRSRVSPASTADYSRCSTCRSPDGDFFTDDDVDALVACRRARRFGRDNACSRRQRPGGQHAPGHRAAQRRELHRRRRVAGQGRHGQQQLRRPHLRAAARVQKQIAAARGARNASLVSQITVQMASKAPNGPASSKTSRAAAAATTTSPTPDFTVESQEDLRGHGERSQPDADRAAGRHRRHLAGGRRHRHHEHHAGVGDRADARDRHPQGGRRAQQRHPDAVPDRSADRDGARRRSSAWPSAWARRT